MNIAFLLMGGKGERFGGDVPKQFTLIDDVPIFAYILKAMDDTETINKIIIVCHEDWIEYVKNIAHGLSLNKVYGVVAGGETRSKSILNGLLYSKDLVQYDDIVLLHDVTHPYIDEEGIKKVVHNAKKYGAATLVSREYDTCYKINKCGLIKGVEKREEIVVGASPEAFKFGELYDIYCSATDEELNEMTSAGALAINHNIKMMSCDTDILNLKLTYHRDYVLLTHLIHKYYFPETKLED